MRPNLIKVILTVVCVLTVFVARDVLAQNYIVVVNHAPPFRIIEGTGINKKFSGVYIDVIREIAIRAHLNLEFREVPFKRALAMMSYGNADIMLGPNRTPEREKFMEFLNVALRPEPKVFLSRPDRMNIRSETDLSFGKIAVLRGGVHYEEFDENMTLRKYEVTSYEEGMRLVSSGRLDYIILPERLADYLVSKNKYDLVKSSYRPQGMASYIAISKLSSLSSLHVKLNLILEEMKEDGTLKSIFASYVGS